MDIRKRRASTDCSARPFGKFLDRGDPEQCKRIFVAAAVRLVGENQPHPAFGEAAEQVAPRPEDLPGGRFPRPVEGGGHRRTELNRAGELGVTGDRQPATVGVVVGT
jgi:hypothetical protein